MKAPLLACLCGILLTGKTISQCNTYTVPFYEGFNVPANYVLPACWAATSFSNATMTFSTGHYAAFSMTATGTNAFYTPGLQLYAGVVYSVSLWHTLGSVNNIPQNLPSMDIMIGTSQNTLGMTSLTNAVCGSVNYTALTCTFTVAGNGQYYIAVTGSIPQATTNSLNWQDFGLTIPCVAANQPTLVVSPNTATVCSGHAFSFSTTVTANGVTTSSVYTSTLNASASLSFSATNTLTGCSVTTSPFVTVKPSPILGILSSPVCEGSAATVQVVGASTYSWPGPGGGGNIRVFIVNLNSTFTVIGTGTNGCSSVSSGTITVYPLPAVVINPASSTICLGDQAILQANGGITYQWIGNPANVSSITVAPNLSTTYYAIGQNSYGCTDTASAFITVDLCTGITDREGSHFHAYPNPAQTQITVEGTFDRIELRDATGCLILFIEDLSFTRTIDIKQLGPGVYFLYRYSHGDAAVVKVMKE